MHPRYPRYTQNTQRQPARPKSGASPGPRGLVFCAYLGYLGYIVVHILYIFWYFPNSFSLRVLVGLFNAPRGCPESACGFRRLKSLTLVFDDSITLLMYLVPRCPLSARSMGASWVGTPLLCVCCVLRACYLRQSAAVCEFLEFTFVKNCESRMHFVRYVY